MRRSGRRGQEIGALFLLIVLLVGLAAGVHVAWRHTVNASSTPILPESISPPPNVDETASAAFATLFPYPGPATPASPASTILPTTDFGGTIPSPPGWPTDLPWPPPPSTPVPTRTPAPFPTPELLPSPTGAPIDALLELWFPSVTHSSSTVSLRMVFVNDPGVRWSQTERSIELGLVQSPSGAQLLDLIWSPNRLWGIADIAFYGTQLIDLETGTLRHFIADPSIGPGRFLAWAPDGQHARVFPTTAPQELWLVEVVSQFHQKLNGFVPDESAHAALRDAAYSPNGQEIADVLAYVPYEGGRSASMLEIGLRKGLDGERRVLAQLVGGTHTVERSLRWSPSGTGLLWIAHIVDGAGTLVTELWVYDLPTGLASPVSQLGQSVQYSHAAAWSPAETVIAALKVEEGRDGRESANNIYIIDPELKTEQQLTHFTGQRLSHLAWSQDGQWLAFAISKGTYGEI